MPSKTDINPNTGKMWAVNPATGQWDDNYWSTVVEPQLKAQYGGGNGESDASKLIQTIMDQQTKALADYTAKANEYDKNNPFAVDKWLGEERDKVKQRLDPYYTQTLGDYLTGINTQIQRGTQDERQMLTELNQDTSTYEGNAKIQLQDALDQSRQGSADAGLYNSGQALREQGKIERQSGQNLSDYLTNAQRKADQIKLNQERNMQDISLQKSQKTRDLAQEQYYQTESQAQQQLGQRENQWTYEKGQYTGAPPAANPNDFSAYLTGRLTA